MASKSLFSLAVIWLTIFEAKLLWMLKAWEPIDPTQGFLPVPINHSNFEIQRPYDVPEDQRYRFINGVHKLWVFKNDKPHTPSSRTNPRTEIRIVGYNYAAGVWQFEANGYVPGGTSGVCIMQVFGAERHATTLMLRVYDGDLYYFRKPAIVPRICGRWFRLNVIHDVDAGSLKVYVDGVLVHEATGRGGNMHYFKCGVYAQDNGSFYMESRWKEIRVLKKYV
nr:citrate-binding protein-like [Ipomoea batatas]